MTTVSKDFLGIIVITIFGFVISIKLSFIFATVKQPLSNLEPYVKKKELFAIFDDDTPYNNSMGYPYLEDSTSLWTLETIF